ncbi:hypothetical protein GY45DRAFT_1307260 [Cubamyces sp. BRFM 1775]|nr:hypothetical protein GY45DRAFT_1307260 [Cubamyces sp. BRFM 1775]
MASSSKRKLDEWTDWTDELQSAAEHMAKHRRTASGSDFSTYDIRHAFDMPSSAGGAAQAPQLCPDPPTTAPPPQHQQQQPSLNEINNTSDLRELLDFSGLDSSQAISGRFERVAAELLHNHRIEIGRGGKAEQLELLEVEFYLYKSGAHEDPFTHASPEQSQSGRWYFHRPPRRSNDPAAAAPAGYRGGTRKGLDLTIGQPPPPPPTASLVSRYFPASHSNTGTSANPGTREPATILRGGVLLRSARRVSDGKVITGPSLLVDEILRLSGASEITELVAVNWDSDIAAFPPAADLPYASEHALSQSRVSTMWLRRIHNSPPGTSCPPSSPSETHPRIFRSPRIGLDISHPSIPSGADALAHPRVAFVARPYRFFVRPRLLTANGRGQTVLGVHDALVARGYCADDAELVGELVRLAGVQSPTAGKYLGALRGGERDGELGEWIGPKGKTVLSSVTAWLRMMGTLRKLGIASAPS